MKLFVTSTVNVLATLALSASAFASSQDELLTTASEDLTPLAASTGDYVIDPQSGPYCTSGYTALNVVVNPVEKTVIETFTGPGTIHGSPTAGQETIEVSLEKTTPLPSFPGEKKMRVVVSGDSIIEQTWNWSPLAGEFGGWRDGATYVRFENPSRLVVFRGGFKCGFQRAAK